MEYKVDFLFQWQKNLVSIVIPVHNREKLIIDTLRSVTCQLWDNLEILVVDDHSIDETGAVVRDYAKHDARVSYLESDGYGACHARNYGLRRTKGEFIQFFDDDDLMCPDYISARMEAIQNEKLDYVGCDFLHFEGDRENIVLHRGISTIPHNIVSHIYYMDLPTQCFLIRRDSIAKMGEWNESVKKLQDMAYFHRLFLLDQKGKWLNKELFMYRIHGNSISTNNRADSKIYAYQEIAKEWKEANRYDEVKKVLDMGICTFLHEMWYENKLSFCLYMLSNSLIFAKRVYFKYILTYSDAKILCGKI